MNETVSQLIGYVAAFMTTFSFLPQAIKTIKDKDTKSISLIMYAMFTFGVFCWLVYGILNKDIPLAVANVVTLGFACTILFLKIKYK